MGSWLYGKLLACLVYVLFRIGALFQPRKAASFEKKWFLKILCMAVLTSLLFDAQPESTSEAVIIDTGHYLTSHIRILPKWTVIYEKM